MADTATVSIRIDTTMADLQLPFRPKGVTYTLSGIGVGSGIWEVGTVEADFTLETIATEGMLILYSLEPSGGGDVYWGPKTAAGARQNLGFLRPGRLAFLDVEPGVTTLRAKSSAGTIKVYRQLITQ